MSHAILRTSPTGPGQQFIGRCTKCGEEGLKMGDALKDCPQDHLVSDAKALMDIIDQKEPSNE
jgi:hypothetical protein